MLKTIMASFQQRVFNDPKSTNSLNKNLDFKKIAISYDDELQTWKAECAVRFANNSDPTSKWFQVQRVETSC